MPDVLDIAGCSRRSSGKRAAGIAFLGGLAMVLGGCTETQVELDRMTGTAFPASVEVDGEPQTLASIFASGGVLVSVDEDQAGIEPLANVDCLTWAEFDNLTAAHRQSPEGMEEYSCYAFTCTRYYVYGLIADHLSATDAGVCDTSTAGYADTGERKSFVVFFRHPGIKFTETQHSAYTLLRVAAHELGHTFNLHHPDAVGQSLMLTGSATSDLVFSNLSRDHLEDHPDDKKYPGTGSSNDVSAAHDAGHAAQAPPEDPPLLTLTVEVDRPAVVSGEPVWATLTLANRGPQPESVFADLRLESGAAEIVVTRPDGGRGRFLPLHSSLVIGDREALDPGAALAASVPIFFGGEGWTFATPGTYLLAARYRDPGSLRAAVEAPPIRIEVAEDAAGRRLVGAAEASREAGKFLRWQGGDHLRSGLGLLSELIESYPESAVADHARLALGVSSSREFQDHLAGRVRPADCRRALGYLEAVDSRRLPDVGRVRKALRQASCYSRLDRREEAVVQLSAVREEAAGRPALERFVDEAVRSDDALARLAAEIAELEP